LVTVAHGDPVLKEPRSWIAEGTWPTGSFQDDAPDAVAHALAISVALAAALAGRNVSHVAAEAGMQRSTIYDVLKGKVWPETSTLAKLEVVLETTLWPPSPPPALRRSSRSAG
jgi:DNA-binding phage protein